MASVSPKTDMQIHRHIIEELTWDPRVDATEVGVEVEGGVVTLTGTVTSWAKRLRPRRPPAASPA
jgi:osmotically-inducible protein OsmY